ncbi:hypothetical protein GCM10009839_64820 [Catenulispora yoronensis]|uniref:SecDF P1 head subdomain domain-containing protein n=1 Tax=Catenulispora yoronensis TaxID=450799 RepID=A0ABP5GKZ5_9ACTN
MDSVDIEERLPEILTAEADRYELPVFSAQHIAESAVRKGFWRQRKVLLLAAVGLLGTTGAGGAVIAAAGHEAHDRVTVTFRLNETFPYPPTAPPAGGVQEWLRNRVHAEGLKDVDITVRQDRFAVAVKGRAADLERLRMLGLPGHLSLLRVWSSGTVPTSAQHCTELQKFGPALQLCDSSGTAVNVSGERDNADLHVVEAHAEQRSAGPDGWTVVTRLDAAGAQSLSNLSGQVIGAHERMWLSVDATVYGQPALTDAARDGVVEFGSGFTKQEATDLATILMTPGYDALANADTTVTVTGG